MKSGNLSPDNVSGNQSGNISKHGNNNNNIKKNN